MVPDFRYFVERLREIPQVETIIDRCNLTILLEPGYEWLADFLAAHRLKIVASMPCYEPENVNTPARQRCLRCQHPGAPTPEPAWLRPPGRLCSRPRLQSQRRFSTPGTGRTRSRLQTRTEKPLRHRFSPPLHDYEHAYCPLRLVAQAQREARHIHAVARRVVQRCFGCRPHVPQHPEHRLARRGL